MCAAAGPTHRIRSRPASCPPSFHSSCRSGATYRGGAGHGAAGKRTIALWSNPAGEQRAAGRQAGGSGSTHIPQAQPSTHPVAVQRADHAGVAAHILYVALPQVAAHMEAVGIRGKQLAAGAGQQNLAPMRRLHVQGRDRRGQWRRQRSNSLARASGSVGDRWEERELLAGRRPPPPPLARCPRGRPPDMAAIAAPCCLPTARPREHHGKASRRRAQLEARTGQLAPRAPTSPRCAAAYLKLVWGNHPRLTLTILQFSASSACRAILTRGFIVHSAPGAPLCSAEASTSRFSPTRPAPFQ